eukprot:8231170-Alexandrium_andersonii.AAC.1
MAHKHPAERPSMEESLIQWSRESDWTTMLKSASLEWSTSMAGDVVVCIRASACLRACMRARAR